MSSVLQALAPTEVQAMLTRASLELEAAQALVATAVRAHPSLLAQAQVHICVIKKDGLSSP